MPLVSWWDTTAASHSCLFSPCIATFHCGLCTVFPHVIKISNRQWFECYTWNMLCCLRLLFSNYFTLICKIVPSYAGQEHAEYFSCHGDGHSSAFGWCGLLRGFFCAVCTERSESNPCLSRCFANKYYNTAVSISSVLLWSANETCEVCPICRNFIELS